MAMMPDTEIVDVNQRVRGRGRRGTSSFLTARIVLIAPFFLLFAVFFVLPIIYTIWESLFQVHRSGLLSPPTKVFAGLANYSQALTDHDFVHSLLRILLYGVVQIPVMNALALVIALVIDSESARFKAFFRTVSFIPYGVPGVIAALLWGYLYTPGVSPIVKILDQLGLGFNFFSRDATLWSIANIGTWTYAGYNMLILLAQLQAVPREIYEAAKIDGASGWRVAWNIKIPNIWPALILITVFSIIGTIQLFAEPLTLLPLDSNISATYTPNLSAYTQAFTNNNYNYAAAQATIIALIALVFSFGFLRLTMRRGEG